MSEYTLTPNRGRVIIRPDDPNKEKIGSLYVMRDYAEAPVQGEIVSVADDVVDFAPGDTVFFGKAAGSKLMLGERGKDVYLILWAKDLLCTLHQGASANAKRDNEFPDFPSADELDQRIRERNNLT